MSNALTAKQIADAGLGVTLHLIAADDPVRELLAQCTIECLQQCAAEVRQSGAAGRRGRGPA